LKNPKQKAYDPELRNWNVREVPRLHHSQRLIIVPMARQVEVAAGVFE